MFGVRAGAGRGQGEEGKEGGGGAEKARGVPAGGGCLCIIP